MHACRFQVKNSVLKKGFPGISSSMHKSWKKGFLILNRGLGPLPSVWATNGEFVFALHVGLPEHVDCPGHI